MPLLLAALPLFAALTARVDDWGKGPARWLMTRDEQRAWSQLKSDQEASDFIDLFWARRDPTPGTERNEFREEFEGRTRAADEGFTKGKVRGAMTDMGRIYIVLGPPRAAEEAMGAITQMSDRKALGKMTFSYTDDDLRRYGLNRSPVFAENMAGEYKLDPSQSNAFGALEKAVAAAVRNKELTAVPEWAMRGGVDPKPRPVIVTQLVDAPKPAAVEQVAAGAHGASRLVLVKDPVASVRPRASGDPFASVASVSTFGASEELGYAFQLCRDAAPDRVVEVGLIITGTSGGKKMSVVSRPQEMRPEPIRAMSSCSLIRATIPLSSLGAGQYKLLVEVSDPATKETWGLEGEFRVE